MHFLDGNAFHILVRLIALQQHAQHISEAFSRLLPAQYQHCIVPLPALVAPAGFTEYLSSSPSRVRTKVVSPPPLQSQASQDSQHSHQYDLGPPRTIR